MAVKDINYVNNINLAGNQIKDVVVEVFTTDPTTVNADKQGRIVSYQGNLYIGKTLNAPYVKLGDAGDITELDGRVDALETTVGDSTDGLVKDVADLQAEVETSGTGLLDRVTTIEGAYASKVSVTPGTGLKTTINDEGIVTGVAPAGTSDLSDWATVDAGLVHTADLINTSAGATDAGKAIKLNSAGKIDNTMIPPLAIAELAGTVDAKSKLTTLSSAEKGDIAKVQGDSTTNNNGVYFLTGVYSDIENWIQIVGPSNVVSVNGESGVVVLDASDVGAIDVSFGPETTLGTSADKIPTSSAVSTALDGKVDANSAITPVTTPALLKVAYDAKGLVTGSATVVGTDLPTGIPQANVTNLVTDLADKLDDSQLVTSFQSTPDDTHIPSEKLVSDQLATKVDKVAGKQLSTEDFTSTEKTKLAGIASGAQVNVIETVKVNGSALAVTDKAVDVTVPTNNNQLTNGAGYQTASDVATAIDDAIDTAKTDYYTKTEMQGFFIVKQSFSTTSDGEGGFTATVNVQHGVPCMAQVMMPSGEVVMASITIGASAVTINTNSAFTGVVSIVAQPN